MRVVGLLVLAGFLLSGCSGGGPAPLVVATPAVQPAGTTPPPFDKQGNANYDASGNYIGPHGVGQLVGPGDNPDRNPDLSTAMSSASDFPAGSCTTTPMGTRCQSSTTSSSSSSASCVTAADGTTRCNQSNN